MKTLKYKFLILLWIFLVGSLQARHNDEKTVIIENVHNVKRNTVLSIRNEYGDIHVNNWDKKEISVKVEIIGRGRNMEQVERILERIDIEIDEDSDEVEYRTEVHNKLGGNGESFEINYTVYMNSENPISFENQFGDVYLPWRVGLSEVEVQYGSLKSDGAEGDFELDLSFGKAEIGDLATSEMQIDYSEVVLAQVENLELEQKFSKMAIDLVENLEMETKYGEVSIDVLVSGEVEAHFSGFKVNTLVDNLIMEANYVSGFEIKKLSAGFGLLDLSGQFTTYKVYLEEGLSANIFAEFSYADLNYSGVNIDFYYKDVENNTKEYKGWINGASNPDQIIRVNSSYGSLKLYQ